MSLGEFATAYIGLLSEQKFLEAVGTYYADDCVSVEASDMGGMGRETIGREAILAKNQWWLDNHEVHAFVIEGPFAHGDERFGAIFDLEVTPTSGPEAGRRLTLREIGIFTVRNGKIAREEFFYSR